MFLNLQSSCFHLPSTGITGMHHHARLHHVCSWICSQGVFMGSLVILFPSMRWPCSLLCRCSSPYPVSVSPCNCIHSLPIPLGLTSSRWLPGFYLQLWLYLMYTSSQIPSFRFIKGTIKTIFSTLNPFSTSPSLLVYSSGCVIPSVSYTSQI